MMLKQDWCGVTLILIFFINFSLDEMIFCLLQDSRDRERLLILLLTDVLPFVERSLF